MFKHVCVRARRRCHSSRPGLRRSSADTPLATLLLFGSRSQGSLSSLFTTLGGSPRQQRSCRRRLDTGPLTELACSDCLNFWY